MYGALGDARARAPRLLAANAPRVVLRANQAFDGGLPGGLTGAVGAGGVLGSGVGTGAGVNVGASGAVGTGGGVPATAPSPFVAGAYAPAASTASVFRSPEDALHFSGKAGNRLVTRAAAIGGGTIGPAVAAALAAAAPAPAPPPTKTRANKRGDFVAANLTSPALQSGAALASPSRR